MQFEVRRGNPYPLGVTLDSNGANVSVFSAAATRIELCLFDENDIEYERIALPFRTGEVHHAYVSGLHAGMHYGMRVHGDQDPSHKGAKVLLDPYAKVVDRRIRWHQSMSPAGDTIFGARMFDRVDTGDVAPKGVMARVEDYNWEGDTRVTVSPQQRVIYEAHVKGLTAQRDDVPAEIRGTYAGLGSDPMIAHLQRLGVTSVELLPIFAFIDDEFLVRQNLSNYWGYQPINFFSPEPRYAAGGPLAAPDELRDAIKKLHQAGLEVILDVVYNHTGEGGAEGPIVSFRGFDNAAYYQFAEDGATYVNDSGTGNTFNVLHPFVTRLILDSLRFWISEYHIDGFRFDLAGVLGRTPEGFDAYNGLLQAMTQDPVISRAVLIAEPWDLGPGGYRLGDFPQPFAEWNDKFRDAIRLGWRGEDLACVHIASRVLGSADRFDYNFRAPSDSINFVTAHDGMTLADLVSYSQKHNEANGEHGEDGHHENISDNFGVEGETDDVEVVAARKRRMRAMLTTLLLSQGTPMVLAGDEAGNSQRGNNNTYGQDNELGWVSWTNGDDTLVDTVAEAIAVRKAHPLFRQPAFLHGAMRVLDGMPDVQWFRCDGESPADADWHDPEWKTLQLVVRGASHDLEMQGVREVMLVIFVLDEGEREITLPSWAATLDAHSRQWRLIMDSNEPGRDQLVYSDTFTGRGQGVYVFMAEQAVDKG